MRRIVLLISAVVLFFGCGSSDKGELIGVQDRPDFLDMQPYGMVDSPQGSFLMGAADEDLYKLYEHQPKTVQVQSFWMDETEITNNEYRQFVYWVRDSIAYRLLGEINPEEYLIEADQWGEELETPLINWKAKIDWNMKNADEREQLMTLFVPTEERFYNTMQIDARKLNYEYYWIDLRSASKKEYGNQTQEEYRGSAFASRPGSLKNRDKFFRKEVINIYPDTLCWMHDYAYSYNDAATRSYFSHPRYDNYPVVGVSYRQAKAFSVWRTIMMNDYLSKQDYARMEDFRLPTEAEWEYAARGKNQNEFPWDNADVKNGDGCFYANFKPDRGNYTKDGNLITSKVAIYSPNSNGLYDMAGNVAEWTSTVYTEAGVDAMSDFNPTLQYNAAIEDPYRLKKKSVRGGSWKDPESFIRSAWRTFEYQNQPRSYIGFRCVRSLATTASGKQKPLKNKNRR